LLLVALGAAFAIFWVEGTHYPIREWLLLRVCGYWALALYWGVGCLAIGVELLDRIAPRQYRVWEKPFVGFALGVATFAVLVFVVGLAGKLSRTFFWVTPGFLTGAGYPSLSRLVRRLVPLLRAARFRPSRVELAALLFGAVGLLLVYVPILTPHNVQHDARWYHLTIAQQYAAAGAITRFPEGWFLGAYPHLASLLYTWAMLMPAGIVHRIELAAHVEFVVFVMTIFATPALVRRLLPGTRLSLSWAAFFLFPGVLVYDSNVSLGADHVAALFAPAGMLAVYPALRTLSVRHAMLVGAFAGAALATKYSALSVAVPLLGALAFYASYLVSKGRHTQRALLSLGAALVAFGVTTAPHFVKNLVWYGDPAYPILHHWFSPRPWTNQAESYFRIFLNLAILSPTHDWPGAFESLWAALTLGFRMEEHGFHADFPTFGFLFAATLYCVPFVAPKWRERLAYGLGFSAALVWYWTNHRDRYLQAVLPWFVAATVTTLHAMWTRAGPAGRVAAVVLVSAQVVSGAGLALSPNSFMIPGGHALTQVIALVGAGYKEKYDERFEPFDEWGFSSWTELGRSVPRGSRVLVHEDRLWLGLDAPVVVDEAAWQGGLCYSSFSTPAAVYDALRKLSVTHVVTGQYHADGGGHGLMGDLVFWDFVFTYGVKIQTSGRLTLWKMPSERPPDVKLGSSLIITCNQSQPLGFYGYDEILRRDPPVTVTPTEVPDPLWTRASYAILEGDCQYQDYGPRLEGASYVKMASRGKVEFWKRLPNGAP